MFRISYLSQIFALIVASNVFISCASFQLIRVDKVIPSSELTVFPLSPALFSWELVKGMPKQVEYLPRKSQSADLPHWLQFAYDGLTSIGYLYGTPPAEKRSITIDVVGVNRNSSFEVRQLALTFHVEPEPAFEFVVKLKIDNMEPRDFCNEKEVFRLSKTFSNFLGWQRKDGSPVVAVNLTSPSQIGQKYFPRSFGAQGVVIYLGSDLNFSSELTKLHEEVKPLMRLLEQGPCPQNLKRTSMEKYFRSQRIHIDWCSFVLKHTPPNETEDIQTEVDSYETEFGDPAPRAPPLRSSIPEKGYTNAVLVATIVPATLGSLLAVILVGIFWNDESEDLPVCRGSDTQECDEPRDEMNFASDAAGRSYQPYQDVVMGEDDNFFLITGDDGRHEPEDDHRVQVRAEPLPQYRNPSTTHPNGSPALTYAV